jgi:3-deoxy-D-manno-octulosonic-acid transferase
MDNRRCTTKLNLMSYFVYFILTSVLFPFLPLFSLLNSKLKKRNKIERIQYLKALKNIKFNHKEIIWIHSASGGEFEQVVPMLENINRSKYFILLSFMSPTIFDIQKNTSLADAVIYHPLDFFWSAKKFINDFKPNYYILNRHDIWPNHIYFAHKNNVKIAIINFNIHLKSARFWWMFKPFNKTIFNKFNKIYTGTKRLKLSISHFINENKVTVTGDTRFNRVINRMKNNTKPLLPEKFNTSKNIILGSIINSDFDVVFDGLFKKFPNGEEDLIEQNNGLIITPHEVDRITISKIENKLTKNKIKYQLYSNINNLNKKFEESTIIVDTVGILADLYKYARISYIGAGFGAGVHNVLEPAVYGCAVSFGPNIYILDEAIEMVEQGFATTVSNTNEFHTFLELLNNENKLNETKVKLKSFVKDNECDINSILDDILNET